MADTRHFLYTIVPCRKTLIEDMSAVEAAVLDEHFAYLKAALSDGRLVLAGPCLDGEFGIVVLQMSGEEEARCFMAADPVVAGGIMTATLHPFRVSLIQS